MQARIAENILFQNFYAKEREEIEFLLKFRFFSTEYYFIIYITNY